MRKLVFLVLIALFAVLAGWVAQRPAFHYLSDLRSSLAVDLTTTPAAATTGNLLGIEPELFALDYGNPERLRLKLDAYLGQCPAPRADRPPDGGGAARTPGHAAGADG
ncbi:hypothetical protein Q3H58_000990 [Pseudomonas psychrotolerans]|nr:hypothetical protein [Pseudomonas psychrotolerans]